MFKISFKDKVDCPFKTVERFNDRMTVVTLKGSLQMPKGWFLIIPKDIQDWIYHHPTIDITDRMIIGDLFMKVQGKALRAEDDKDNPILAERIAESRAKYRLYKFVYTLCCKLSKYYTLLLTGKDGISTISVSQDFIHRPQKDCLQLALDKYSKLMVSEAHHLGKLLEQS